nr:MAG TPA: hypothetical protein [Bacteriophage sp.]
MFPRVLKHITIQYIQKTRPFELNRGPFLLQFGHSYILFNSKSNPIPLIFHAYANTQQNYRYYFRQNCAKYTKPKWIYIQIYHILFISQSC